MVLPIQLTKHLNYHFKFFDMAKTTKKSGAKRTRSTSQPKLSAGEIEVGFDAKNRKVTLSKTGTTFSVTEPDSGLLFETENEATARNVYAHALTNSQAFAIEY